MPQPGNGTSFSKSCRRSRSSGKGIISVRALPQASHGAGHEAKEADRLNDSLRFVYFCEDAKDVNLLIWAAMMQTQPLAISESVCDGSLTQQCVHAVVRKDSQP